MEQNSSILELAVAQINSLKPGFHTVHDYNAIRDSFKRRMSKHDLATLDSSGICVGVLQKGKQYHVENGFVLEKGRSGHVRFVEQKYEE